MTATVERATERDYSDLEVTIGLEVHSQVLTASKMFCACSSSYAGASPNTHVCPICLGMPGVLPVVNQQAVVAVIKTGLALNCQIATWSKFDRKNYPYPDLMKGYQISQYDLPICYQGWLEIDLSDGGTKRLGITRVHMEEDTAKLTHVGRERGGEQYTIMDVNRAGVPLMEIVGEPDISSPEEARQYLMRVRQIVRYLGVSTGNMEEGSFRCDANISLRPRGQQEYGTRAEVKNMNSFSAVFHALEYEIKRQGDLLRSGQRVVQETRGWIETLGITRSQRSKEEANDYRYFPEPDLPALTVTDGYVAELRATLPELPTARRNRLVSEYGLERERASQLTESRATADYFEAVVSGLGGDPTQRSEYGRQAFNWITNDLARLLHDDNLAGIEESKVSDRQLAGLIRLLLDRKLNKGGAITLLELLYATAERTADPAALAEREGLLLSSDSNALAAMAQQVIVENPDLAAKYRAGKLTVVGALVGQMKRLDKNVDSAAAKAALETLLATPTP